MTSSSAASILVPLNNYTVGASSNNPPAPEDDSSFSDVMQQQDTSAPAGTDSDFSHSTSVPTQVTPNSPASSKQPDETASPKLPRLGKPGDGSHAKAAQQTQASTANAANNSSTDLKTLLIRASVLASGNQAASTASPKSTSPTADSSKAGESSASAENNTNLSFLIAQNPALMTNAKTAGTTATPTPSAKSSKSDGTTDPQKTTNSNSGTSDFFMLLSQASTLLLNAQATTTTASGKDLPISGSGASITAGSGKEKKSSSTSSEGSFLQPGTSTANGASSLLGALGFSSSASVPTTHIQQLASGAGSKKSAFDALSGIGAGTSGTANVEKKPTMNAEQSLPGLLNGIGTAATAQQAPLDMQIKLSSNTDFDHALANVLHVASLAATDSTGASLAPTRVAIELQTPPGAIVNVYVTRQADDTYRAQLSTSDPAALSWVQDKIGTLKENSSPANGVEVKWQPAQLEATTASTSSGSNGSNFGWERNGQGQAQYQQDEGKRSNQQNHADEDDLAAAGSEFMNNLNSFKEAA